MYEPRVVITGIGPVTPIGTGVGEFWTSLREGRSGIGRIRAYESDGMKVQIAAEVSNFSPGQYMEEKAARRMARFAQMAVAASHLAQIDAGLDLNTVEASDVATIINTGGGGITTIAEEADNLTRRGANRVGALFVPKMATNMAACQVSIEFGFQGPVVTSAAACASSIYAFIDALQMMRADEAKLGFTGGTESNVSVLGISGMANMQALSRRNDEPERASRPFDIDRDGFVFGEGAIVCVLERLEDARARGARIYAEILSGGRTADAHHITAPREDGAQAAKAMELAVRRAQLVPEDIDYICAHGTGTPLNDAAETRAIKLAFGDHAYSLAISSPKSITGHLMGAAGAVSVASTALAIYHQEIPPTMNLDSPDPECDLDYVPNLARKAKLRYALANGFGFGGQNGVVALGRIDE